jgi:hypothetical protein
MAKFVPAIGDVAGKIGNLVFSRNRYGPTIRRRAVPVNLRSTAQRKTRGILSAASAYWRQMIAPNACDVKWNVFAANFPLHQGKGTKTAVSVTGQAFSVAVNALRYLFGASACINPPDTWGTDQPTGVTAAAVAETSLIISAIPGVTLDATHGVMVKATGPLSRGVSFIGKSKYKFIAALAPTQTLPIDVSAAYKAVFGNIPLKDTAMGVSVQVVKLLTTTTSGVTTACPGQPVFTKIVVA